MTSSEINKAIERATEVADRYPERKNEVFTAVLTAELLRGGTSVEPTQPTHVALATKQLSIQEILRDRKPTNDVERALLLGYYIEAHKGNQSFTAKEISACFKEAREPVPQNVPDKILMNVKKGWIMTTGSKRDGAQEYTLTNTGLQIAQQGFAKKGGT